MATILIIDDEEGLRKLLHRVLEGAGHNVMEASNGHEGLELFRRKPADLVITDILMPDTDGMATTLELTREYPSVKVIAMTGAQGDRNFLEVAKRFGAHHTLMKPFAPEELREAVRQVLEEEPKAE